MKKILMTLTFGRACSRSTKRTSSFGVRLIAALTFGRACSRSTKRTSSFGVRLIAALAAVLCCFISVNAQTTETESNSERYLRLSKEADENPSDWKAQMEVVHILTDKNSGFYEVKNKK